jgi:hypothetical protein
MKRVVILGPEALGKSTLAVRLGEITGLRVIELDKLFWQPGLVATSRDQWLTIQEHLVEENEWIMDGDLGRMMRSKSGFVQRTQSFSWTSPSCAARGGRPDVRASALISGSGCCGISTKPSIPHASDCTARTLRNPPRATHPRALGQFVANVVRDYQAGQPRPGIDTQQ